MSPRTVAEFVRLEAAGGAACVIQGSRASVQAALNLDGFGAHVREQGDFFPLGRLSVKLHLFPTTVF